MDCQPLIAGPVIRCSAGHIGADKHAAIGPPERDLVPEAGVPDGDEGERAERPLRNEVVPDTEARGEGGAIAVVPVEELQDARGRPCCADSVLDTVPVDGIDRPHAAVLDEGVRATLHELVDDPAEAAVELVAEPDLQRCHVAAQRSKSGKSDSRAASISCSMSNGIRRNETSSSSVTIAYSLQGKNGTGSGGWLCS